MEKLTWANGWECHYGSERAVINKDYDLDADYDNPKSHKALVMRGGKPKVIRVIIDHHATGTRTTGTGDTVVRSIPRGWRSGEAA